MSPQKKGGGGRGYTFPLERERPGGHVPLEKGTGLDGLFPLIIGEAMRACPR